MAEEREIGVAGTEVTGDAEVRGGREQGARDRGSLTGPDVDGDAGRPSQAADDADDDADDADA
jgi:hypothetical protein